MLNIGALLVLMIYAIQCKAKESKVAFLTQIDIFLVFESLLNVGRSNWSDSRSTISVKTIKANSDISWVKNSLEDKIAA